jgi:plastocyanin
MLDGRLLSRPGRAIQRRALAVAIGGSALLASAPGVGTAASTVAADPPTTHIVATEAENWSVREVDAVVGDSVEWRWEAGFHDLWIVDAAVPLGQEAGAEERLRDVATAGAPPVTRAFPAAGAWDYYCKVHNGRGPGEFNMSGRITVAEREPDVVAPATTASLSPATPGPGGTYAGPVTVTLTATDEGGSGLAQTRYRLDGGAEQIYGDPFTVTAPGAHTVAYASTDNDGNAEAVHQVAFTIAAPGGGAPPPTPPVIGGGSVPLPPEVPSAKLGSLPRRIGGAALARGLRVPGSCAAASSGTLRLRVSRTQARKLRLGGKPVTLATTTVRCANGRFAATLRPKGRARRALRKARGRIAATLELRMIGAGGVATDTARLTIKGRPASS